MATNKLLQSPGIVTSEMAYKENSKILRIFTRDYGRLGVLAQGVQKPSHELFSLSQQFVEGHFEMRPGRSLFYLQDGEILQMHYGLRQDIQKLSFANLITEALEKALDEGQADPAIFTLIIQSLSAMDHADPQIVTIAFLMHLISLSGLRPRFSHCVICQTKKFKRMAFSIREGGILCETCMESHSFDLTLTQDLYYALHRLTCASFFDSIQTKVSEKQKQMLLKLALDLCEHYFQVNLKSKGIFIRLGYI